MVIIFAVFLFVCLYGCKVTVHGINKNYMSRENTLSIRGICALVVVMHHILLDIGRVGKPNYFDNLQLTASTVVTYLAVAIFFFYSGYGLMYSLQNKNNYLCGFIKHRLSKIFVPYALVVVIYALVKTAVEKITFSDIVKSFVIGDPVADNSWYIIAIIIFYFLFWVSFKFIKNQNAAIIVLVFLTFVYAFVCAIIGFNAHWFNSVFAFPLGIIWAKYRENILSFAGKKYLFLFLSSWIAFAAFFAAKKLLSGADAVFGCFAAVFFVIAIMAVFMKVTLKNKILNFIGEISFELYMIHGLFVYLFKRVDFVINNSFFFALCVFAASIISACIMHYFNKKMFSIIMPNRL